MVTGEDVLQAFSEKHCEIRLVRSSSLYWRVEGVCSNSTGEIDSQSLTETPQPGHGYTVLHSTLPPPPLSPPHISHLHPALYFTFYQLGKSLLSSTLSLGAGATQLLPIPGRSFDPDGWSGVVVTDLSITATFYISEQNNPATNLLLCQGSTHSTI